jgi:hypothetical protein
MATSPLGRTEQNMPVKAISRTTRNQSKKSAAKKAKRGTLPAGPLSEDELRRMDMWWRAANYLSVGQIYLMDNPLLREELEPEHVKPRLLGHWGTTPGLNFLYAHLNRAITQRDLDMIYIIGPGHGGPSLVSAAWLEGTYTEVYPNITRDAGGMRRLFTQFSFPGVSRATWLRRLLGRSMRVASSDMRSLTRTAPPSTTRT